VEILEAVINTGWDDIRFLERRNGFTKQEEALAYNNQLLLAQSRRSRAPNSQSGFMD
jgi:hypothetical protein